MSASKQASVLGGSLLIAGTSIGGGMLALPVLTAQAGFFPSLAIYFLCWLFMACTGLLFLEVSQWMKNESNLVTMAETTLGKKGKYFVWILYLLLFYCLTVAYMVGCGNLIVDLSQHTLPDWSGPLIFVILFAPLILVSNFFIEKLNIFLVFGLAVCYFGFVILGFKYVNLDLLQNYNWSYSSLILPIAFTSFAYQGIIPTLATYMHYDACKIRRSILIGSFIPLIAYIVWEGLILGIVPLEGKSGLIETLNSGDNAVYPLKYFIHNEVVYILAEFFGFFALITSFIGVTLGLRDFIADGLSIEKKGIGKLALLPLVFLIPLLISMSYPQAFLIALEYAGGFGCALLLGLLPIIMTWRGRYRLNLIPYKPQLPGGRGILLLLATFVIVEIAIESARLIQRILA